MAQCGILVTALRSTQQNLATRNREKDTQVTHCREGREVGSFEEIFESTTDAVFGTDKHMRVRFWNRCCEKLFKIKKNKAIGRSCHELICGKDLQGNNFCNKNCTIAKHHDRSRPNRDWDLVLESAEAENESVVVNVGSYYLDSRSNRDDSDICVFHSMRVINCHQLIMRLSSSAQTRAGNNKITKLSKREYEVFQLISSGANPKNIAQTLGISVTTVRNHIKNIYTKLGVHSQAEAINCAVRNGIV